jgi:hypothetical protein
MELANKEYFFKYCNKILGTHYITDDYPTDEDKKDSKRVINIYWLVRAVQKVYDDIHQPKPGCRFLLSKKFDLSELTKSEIVKLATEFAVIDTTLVRTVVNYLYNFNKVCDLDCACPCGYNCPPNNCYNCQHCGICNKTTCAHCYYINSACYPYHCNECGWFIHCWQQCNGGTLDAGGSVGRQTVRTCQYNTNSAWACLYDCGSNCSRC